LECDTKSVHIKKKKGSGEMYRILIVDDGENSEKWDKIPSEKAEYGI